MEELAYKSPYPVPDDIQAQIPPHTDIIRSVITYNYGENISRWAAILPWTFGGNHYGINSILNVTDGDGTTYYAIANSAYRDWETGVLS